MWAGRRAGDDPAELWYAERGDLPVESLVDVDERDECAFELVKGHLRGESEEYCDISRSVKPCDVPRLRSGASQVR